MRVNPQKNRMKKIFKYSLNHGTTRLFLPQGAEVLSVGVQTVSKPGWESKLVRIWCLVDADTPKTETRIFNIYPTGVGIPFRVEKFIGTVFIDDEVYHVFEEIK